MANVSYMMAATNVALDNAVRKTFHGSEKDLENDHIHIKEFKFTSDDIGKFVVIEWNYEENGFAIDRLSINNHILDNRDSKLYGVYEICYHSWCAETKDVSYKIYLKPIGKFAYWCPDRSWYTYDIEQHINNTYNIFEENPVFDNVNDAIRFALKKNFELYPDNR